ncbi:MAG: PfkB family carbohydrate kinase [Candidatus Nanopelagicales bacterium]
MADSGRVISLCSILVDVTLEVPCLPGRAGDVLATATRSQVGAGFNLVAAAARQSVTSMYAGVHGSGRNGDMIRAALAEEGVGLTLPPRQGQDSGFCIAMLEPDGQGSYITMPGVEATLAPSDLARLAVHDDDVLALSGYDLLYPVSGPSLISWLAAQPWGAGRGPRVLLDPGPLEAQIPDSTMRSIMASVDVLTLNLREARLLAGVPDAAGPELLANLREHVAIPKATAIIVRSGADGSVATGGPLGDQLLQVAAPRVTVVDSTGAGDAHTGVLAAEMVRGVPFAEAMLMANRAAAISVTRSGPATAPTRAEIGAQFP